MDTARPDLALTSTARRGPSRLVWLVVVLGAAYSFLGALLGDRSDSSALWFLDPLLYGLFIVGLLLRERGWLPRWQPASVAIGASAYIGLSWLTAMTYELSLRTGSTGFGGLHTDTLTSFVFGQGYYLPLAIGGWWLLRRFHYDLNWVFWTGTLVSLYETLTVGAVAVAGGNVPLLSVPLLLGYYLTTYALYLVMPLLLIDERALWSPTGGTIRPLARVAVGIGFGVLLWLIYLAWASLVSPLLGA